MATKTNNCSDNNNNDDNDSNIISTREGLHLAVVITSCDPYEKPMRSRLGTDTSSLLWVLDRNQDKTRQGILEKMEKRIADEKLSDHHLDDLLLALPPHEPDHESAIPSQARSEMVKPREVG